MAKQFKDSLKALGERIKTETPTVPIQEVRPVEPAPAEPTKSKSNKEDSHVNFWIPKELMTELKICAARSGKSLKQIGIEAFEAYLKAQNK